jgi:uncharacterized membrane protein (UPF0127 family)
MASCLRESVTPRQLGEFEEGLVPLQSANSCPAPAQKLRVRNLTKNTVIAKRAAIADTSRTRKTGLLKHTSLPAGEGLWIVPCEGVHMFGMKFAIDVLFLSKKRKVLKVSAGMQASGIRKRMALNLLAHSVLELPEGMAAETRTEVGDQLELEKFDE